MHSSSGRVPALETGGTAVCGFSNVGMVGVIAAGHLVRTLELEQRATVLDASFPAMALIKDEVRGIPSVSMVVRTSGSSHPRSPSRNPTICCSRRRSWSGTPKEASTV